MIAKLTIPVVILFLLAAAPVQVDDSIAEKLAEAKETYRKAVEGAKKPILNYLDEAESKAREDANGDLVKVLQGERKAFESEGTIPKRLLPTNRNTKGGKARKAMIESYEREAEQAKRAVLDVYNSSYKKYLVDRNDNDADKIKAEMEQVQKSGKLVVAGIEDKFQPGSVWSGTRTYPRNAFDGVTVSYHLHVRERHGNKFIGHAFDNGTGRNRVEVEGEIQGDNIAWKDSLGSREVVWVKRGTIQGNIISFKFERPNNDDPIYVGSGAVTLVTPNK